MEPWRVHKFGGSSVADAACMERVARILEDDPRRRVAAVLSACRGVTDALLAMWAGCPWPGQEAGTPWPEAPGQWAIWGDPSLSGLPLSLIHI